MQLATRELKGIGLSPGIAIGTAYRVKSRAAAFYRIRIAPEEVARALNRLKEAIAKSRRQLGSIKKKFDAELGKEHSYVIDAHLLMLEDRQFIGEIEQKIQQGLESPERAANEVGERWLAVYRSLKDPFFQERGSDLQEVVERIIANLTALDSQMPTTLPDDLVLAAPEISLSTLADYEVDKVKGLVLTNCGRTSHVTIIARSYQIPVVSGIERIEDVIRTGETMIVDGSAGTVHRNPSAELLREYRGRLEEERRRMLVVFDDSGPAVTLDGRRVFLHTNTEVGSEVPSALKLGAEGVGLFRTEYVYMKNKRGVVSEEQQFEIYKHLAQTVQDRPAIIRTLDIGDGRHPYFSKIAGEGNSVLGLRGIRLGLKCKDIFKSQVRAILRAAYHGNLKIVLPMVSSADEVIEGRKLIREVEGELEEHGVPIKKNIEVGVMLEVPAAILSLEAISSHSDFLAVGTNDLIQYTLAAGRTNERIAYLFNAMHPAIFRSLKRIAQLSQEQEQTTLVCGEMAAHPVCAYVLVGMSFQHLSMNPYAIADIKKTIRKMKYAEACKTVGELLQLSTVREVEEFLQRRFNQW